MDNVIADAGLAQRKRASRWPARLDLLQSGSGLALALFMWAHMLFVSSILLGKDAMWAVTKFFEGYYFFGESHPWLVSIAAASVLALIVLHAALAVRKFPTTHRQYSTFREHMHMMHHEDTTLWFWQVFTGFALFFLASIHLYVMVTQPELIGPYESSDRVVSQRYWPLYLLLLLAVEFHGGIGLYRLAVKWGWFTGRDADTTRRRLKRLKWGITLFLVVLGLATLGAYIKIWIEHRNHAGERYVPAYLDAYAPTARIAP